MEDPSFELQIWDIIQPWMKLIKAAPYYALAAIPHAANLITLDIIRHIAAIPAQAHYSHQSTHIWSTNGDFIL